MWESMILSSHIEDLLQIRKDATATQAQRWLLLDIFPASPEKFFSYFFVVFLKEMNKKTYTNTT